MTSSSGDGFWTQERVERVRRLAAEKVSAASIARMIGAASGSAVVGLCRRRGIQLLGQPGPRARKPFARIASVTAMAPNRRSLGSSGPAGIPVSLPRLAWLDGPADPSRAGTLPRDPARAGAGGGVAPRPDGETTSGPRLLPRADEALPRSRPARLHELAADGCHWPLGDPRAPEFRCCGAPKADDPVYCEAHRALATAPGMRAPGWISRGRADAGDEAVTPDEDEPAGLLIEDDAA